MDEEVPLDSIHPRCVTSGTHLIVGGFGGLGVELCDWLLSNGAACVVLAGSYFPGVSYSSRGARGATCV